MTVVVEDDLVDGLIAEILAEDIQVGRFDVREVSADLVATRLLMVACNAGSVPSREAVLKEVHRYLAYVEVDREDPVEFEAISGQVADRVMGWFALHPQTHRLEL